MKRVMLNGLLSWSLILVGGCGQVGNTAAEDVASEEAEVAVPVLWQCKAVCTNAKGNKKVKYISCATNNVVSKNDAAGECKKAYGNASTVVSATCRTVRPLTLCKLPSGGGNGDPHMFSYDGLRFDVQSLGEFVLASDNESYTIQARFEQWGGSRASVQTAVSVDMGDVRVGMYLKEQPTLRVNGAPAIMACAEAQVPVNGSLCSGRIDFDNGGWLTYDKASNKFSVYLQDEVSHIDVWLRGSYMNTQFFAGPMIQAKTYGLVGNVNGIKDDDYMTRDGKVIAQPVSRDDLYGIFANSWRIHNAESAFDYAPGKSTASFTDMAFPGIPMTVKDVPPADHAAAEAACKAKGVPADMLEDCVLDAAVMGHEAAADFTAFGKF